jgi:hypothetical protein
MKRIVSVIVFLVVSFFSYGQSLKLLYEGSESGDTIVINHQGIDDFQYYYIDIVNTSSDTVDVMIRRDLLDLLPEAENYFCYRECFISSVNETNTPAPLAPGDTASHTSPKADFNDTANYDANYAFFYTGYNPNGQEGTSFIKYTFYDNKNPLDAVSVIFQFITETVGIDDNKTQHEVVINAYPNPASSEITVEHDFIHKISDNVRIHLFDATGAVVKSVEVNPTSNKTKMVVAGFASGIYFYALEKEGKIVATQKLIIK